MGKMYYVWHTVVTETESVASWKYHMTAQVRKSPSRVVKAKKEIQKEKQLLLCRIGRVMPGLSAGHSYI